MITIETQRLLVADALRVLGIERLVLGVHDACFPGFADEDIGRGSPYSFGARSFLRFAAGLGFTGVQLGPQGRTSPINASPYDGTLFAKSPLSIALGPLASAEDWEGLLSQDTLAICVRDRPIQGHLRVEHAQVLRLQHMALQDAYAAFCRQRGRHPAVAHAFADFVREQTDWLAADALYEAMAAHHGTFDWRRWSGVLPQAEVARLHADVMEFSSFCQFLVHAQHGSFREEMATLGLRIYGDLQIGVSHRDLWRYRPLFLTEYVMGAPPSRTNPAGQPWGYPVLDPDTMEGRGDDEGAGLRFVRSRVGKLLAEFDGLRIDHPHGLVCPWVYRTDDPDPFHAVRTGARLFASPDLPDHPGLARYALVTRADLAPNANHPRHADDWVRSLSSAQVAAHSRIIDILVETVLNRGGRVGDIACEVLSTCPSPLAAVVARHGLGRFRVTQKADPTDENDPYRTSLASPADWVMVGTHDTPPLWRTVDDWQGDRPRCGWAHYLATRLEPDVSARPAFAMRLERDPAHLKLALFADLFVGPARNVSIFFADLFGMKEIYNRPGEIHPENWTLRIPPDYAQIYRQRREAGMAVDLPRALALALRARVDIPLEKRQNLVAALERRG